MQKRNKIRTGFFIFLLLFLGKGYAQQVFRPFPQHAAYFAGVISPSHIASKELDDSVRSFYLQWKNRYIRKSHCSDSYYVWSENSGRNHECVSEGQGYGMIIVVLMAGADPLSQATFDGLLKYYLEHPSKRSKVLMSWAQRNVCGHDEESSASDGDIDIAYSLLLADKQWSSHGNINYLLKAKSIIGAVMDQEINGKTYSVLESNSIESDSRDYFDMRSSDFIPSEFRSFYKATSKNDWLKTIDSCYKLFSYVQQKYSPEAGLMPDFIQAINKSPAPAKKHYLESKYDGIYNYNASRVPWRIATDFIITGDRRSKLFLEPVNEWIRSTTAGNPDNISAGYTLEGDDLKSRHFEALSFISSFAVAAMTDAKNQEWLNKLWDYIIRFKLKDFDYFDNSIKMLNLIILSHNYWTP
ncbi:MAG TPA: glycosyl hydrolase family 8 [Puia sp.]|nr:glycosyl hydrolase family 8 [Puia sp.]